MDAVRKKLEIKAKGDREIVMTREFDAPARLVYDAYTKPELLKRWLGVFGGWELAVCEVDLRVGGKYRWVWRKAAEKAEMGAGGIYRELVSGERIVCTEKFDQPWYPGENLITTTFVERNGRTAFTSTMLYDSAEARDMVLKSPMESGVAQSYDALDAILASDRKKGA